MPSTTSSWVSRLLASLDGDDALLSHLLHRLGDQVADGAVAVSRHDAHLGDFGLALGRQHEGRYAKMGSMAMSPRGLARRMYRWTVLLQMRMPSLSSSPRRRSAPQRGLLLAISRMSAARAVGGRPDGRERRRQNARKPALCQRRMVAGWTSNVASRHAGARRAASPIVKRCHGAHRTRDLSLHDDELLPKQ